MNELALFAGAGGGLLAGHLLGWAPIGGVEIDSYCARTLRQRQLDGCLPSFPIWSDIRTFDGRPWRGAVDVISGGFPCQDISSAGKRAGIESERSGLWREMLRIVDEVGPQWVFAENSPHLRTRGLDLVIEGLTRLGYRVAWGVLGADHFGAPHERRRMWIVANADHEGERALPLYMARTWPAHAKVASDAADANGLHVRLQSGRLRRKGREEAFEFREALWGSFPDLTRVADGVAHRMDRIRATGNGQVPIVAAAAWDVLRSTLG
jgi:DNA (cytosine-5)-methyltransferase 1